MTKRLIICFSDNDIRETVRLAQQENDSLVIAMNEDISEFRKNNLYFKTLQAYALNNVLSSLPKLVYEHYLKWGNLAVNGLQLKNILKSEKFDFWQNVQATFCDKLYAHKTPDLKFVLIFKEIFSAETPGEVYANQNTPAGPAAGVVAKSLGLSFKKFGKPALKNPIIPILARLSHALVLTQTKKLEYPAMTKTGKRRIIFVLSMPSALQALLPIIEAVRKKFDVLCVLVEISKNENLEMQTKKKNMPYVMLQSYYSPYVHKRVKEIYEFYGRIDFLALKFEFLRVDVTAMIKNIFKFYFQPRQYAYEVILVNELFKNMIITEQPDIIITVDESSDLSKPMLDYAKSVGIKTLAMQHAFLEQYPAFENTISPDKIAAWGAASAGQYTSQGFPAERITITGSPKFDSLARQKFDAAAAAQKYGLDTNRKTILFGSQPILESELTAILDALVSYVNANELQLVIKLHPREDETFYKKFAARVKTKCAVTKDDLHPLILFSDVVVISSSLVGLEAAILGRPVVLANFSGLPDRLNYVSDGIALGAKSAGELHKTLNLLINAQAAREKLTAARLAFFSKHLNGLDGKATERVVTVIEELLGMKKA